MGDTSSDLRLRDALRWAIRLLAAQGLESPRLDAELLLGHLLGLGRAQVYAHDDEVLSQEASVRYRNLVRRRAGHEPVAYLIGRRAFWDLDLEVAKGVLIPRPETEHLVEAALGWCTVQGDRLLRIVDVGTGSGAIAAALAKHVANGRVAATDLSATALAIARRNMVRAGLVLRVSLIRADLLEALAGPLDLIAANLPYIPRAEIGALDADIRDYEPRMALDGGLDGLDLIRRLLARAPAVLAKPGLLLLEIDHRQAKQVARLCGCHLPDADVRVIPDYAGLGRVVRAERPAQSLPSCRL